MNGVKRVLDCFEKLYCLVLFGIDYMIVLIRKQCTCLVVVCLGAVADSPKASFHLKYIDFYY